jgi:hypothetical protein
MRSDRPQEADVSIEALMLCRRNNPAMAASDIHVAIFSSRASEAKEPRLAMKTIVSAIAALSVLSAIAVPASAKTAQEIFAELEKNLPAKNVWTDQERNLP